jgi:hypothetical protein
MRKKRAEKRYINLIQNSMMYWLQNLLMHLCMMVKNQKQEKLFTAFELLKKEQRNRVLKFLKKQ